MHKRANSESIISKYSQRTNSKNALQHDGKREIRNENKDTKNEKNPTKEKKLENVVVRIRNLEKNEPSTLHTDPKDKTVLYFDKDYEIEKYNFDIVFDGNDSNKSVFERIGGNYIISNVFTGYKETIIAYGQTGSGKTHTLFGSRDEVGIVYYFLEGLCTMNSKYRNSMYLCIYEIVGDTLKDLISNFYEQQCEFYWGEYYLKTVKYTYKVVNIKSYKIAKDIINTACQLRNVDTTSQNKRSSRSHAILQFFINRSERILQSGKEQTQEYLGVLTLVDLVGCEREEFHINRTEGKNESKQETKNERTSSKVLNSSLTSLNKMLRKMQMGILNESDKRQSVLCKVLFDYIQKNCGLCLIFCFNPRIDQKCLTSSTLMMAQDCKKIKNKRKQLIYVKTDEKEKFFKNMSKEYTHRSNINKIAEEKEQEISAREEGGKEKQVEIEKERNIETQPNKEWEKQEQPKNNESIFFIFLNYNNNNNNNEKEADIKEGATAVTKIKRTEDDKTKKLKNLIQEIINEENNENRNCKYIIEQLKSDIVKLKNECRFWKKETQNYHNKLKILNKNYSKINEFLTNTLNTKNAVTESASFMNDSSTYNVKEGNNVNEFRLSVNKNNHEQNNIYKEMDVHKEMYARSTSVVSNINPQGYTQNSTTTTSTTTVHVKEEYKPSSDQVKEKRESEPFNAYDIKNKDAKLMHRKMNDIIQEKLNTVVSNNEWEEHENISSIDEQTHKQRNSQYDEGYKQNNSSVERNNELITKESKIIQEMRGDKDKMLQVYNNEQRNHSYIKREEAYQTMNHPSMNKEPQFNSNYHKTTLLSRQPIVHMDHHPGINTKTDEKNNTDVVSKCDVKKLNQVTIDSLANRLRNRMLKSRSLSVAR